MLPETDKTSNKLLSAALADASKGWPVFPCHHIAAGKCSCGKADCHSPGKHPRTPNGVKDATLDAEQIKAWWAQWPDANIGLDTSKLLVLDADGAQGLEDVAQLEAKHGPLPETRTIATPGDGKHFYFLLPTDGAPIRNRAKINGLSIDVRGVNGYVLAPPSNHAARKNYTVALNVPLAEAPQWLLDLVRSKEPATAETPAKSSSTTKYATAALVSEVAKVATAPVGSRNSTLNSAAFALGTLVAAGALDRDQVEAQLSEAARRSGLGSDEIAGTLKSGIESGMKSPRVIPATSTGSTSMQGSPYSIQNGCIIHWRATRDGPVPIPLCNFTARIVEQLVIDDGAERRISLKIEGKLATGEPLPAAEVSASELAPMNWITTSWGTKAVLYAGLGCKDHFRVALQLLSGDVKHTTKYAHTGWREINGEQVYLHAAGAIGSNGSVLGVETQLPDCLAPMILPEPPTGNELRAAIRASVLSLDVAPDPVTVPQLAAVYRAVFGGCDFGISSTGPTGTCKTELAARAQQHWGAGFDARHLPGSWGSTANSNEALGFTSKDMLLTLDDFAPHGTQSDVARFHKEADRLWRAAGNRAGRARCRQDGSLRPAKPPRCLFYSTGEDVPRGQSCQARQLITEISPGDVDLGKLTKCQDDGANGLYVAAMAGYLKWLAPQVEEIKRTLPGKITELRSELQQDGAHARTPGQVADLLLGFRYFLQFALDVGAITTNEQATLEARARAALLEAAALQSRHIQSSEPTGQFLRLLVAALSSGRAHIAAVEGGSPLNCNTWGWRTNSFGSEPQGRRIGWLDGDNLYLEPDATQAEVQALAGQQGESIPLGARTLAKRMKEKGLLVTWDEGRFTTRKMLEGNRRYVLHLRAGSIYAPAHSISPQVSQVSQVSQTPQKHEENATSSWLTHEKPPEIVSQRVSQDQDQDQGAAGSLRGSLGIHGLPGVSQEKPSKTREITPNGSVGSVGSLLGDKRERAQDQDPAARQKAARRRRADAKATDAQDRDLEKQVGGTCKVHRI